MARSYSLVHVADGVLLRNLAALVAQDRTTTAELLAHLAEVDARRLYLPAGFPSMFAYCAGELGLSEEAAFKRIRVARAARQFPDIFTAIADGRLNLSGIVVLTPHLTPETADELMAAAAHKSRSEIEQLMAQRFPRPDVPAQVQPIPPSPPSHRGASISMSRDEQLSPGTVEPPAELLAPGPVERPAPPARVTPLAPQRFALQMTIEQSTRDKLSYAQELLSHQVPSRDLAQVLDRVLDIALHQLEKRKFAATDKPRSSHHHATAGTRHIPGHVKRAVWQRDGGQCTFVSASGHRCPARTLLEYDHIDEVARRGEATVSNVRLRCRSHNQFGAECTFGTEFMRHKREEARRARAEARRAAAARRVDEARAKAAAAAEQAAQHDVVSGLRSLGFRADEARRGAERCGALPDDTPLEERLRVALRSLGRAPSRRWCSAADGLGAAL